MHRILGWRGEWVPWGARETFETPQVGAWVAWEYQVWRVLEVRPFDPERWTQEHREWMAEWGPQCAPVHVWVRPAEVSEVDPVRARARDQSLQVIPTRTRWWTYPDEHYPVCATCGGAMPCLELYAAAVAEREVGALAPFEVAGVCPACRKPVSSRQRSVTFPDNLVIPGGPALTFHRKQGCLGSAMSYEERWVAADENRRRTTLSCPGTVTNHNDGTYDCTELVECRGPGVYHKGGYTTCRCPDCHARGRFGCHPKPTARRNEGRVDE